MCRAHRSWEGGAGCPLFSRGSRGRRSDMASEVVVRLLTLTAALPAHCRLVSGHDLCSEMVAASDCTVACETGGLKELHLAHQPGGPSIIRLGPRIDDSLRSRSVRLISIFCSGFGKRRRQNFSLPNNRVRAVVPDRRAYSTPINSLPFLVVGRERHSRRSRRSRRPRARARRSRPGTGPPGGLGLDGRGKRRATLG